VILTQNGVELTHEPQYVGFNEQWLNGPRNFLDIQTIEKKHDSVILLLVS